MTDDDLARMRAYAEAAREHPTWSVAYAQDVPRLLAEFERQGLLLRDIARAVRGEADGVMEFQHLDELPKDVRGSNRIWSEAAAAQRAIIERLTSALDQVANDVGLAPIERRQIAGHALAGVVYAEPVEHDKLWHRLRFAEMVLDRIGAEVDGVPWREAARLTEALNGEPVTEPVAVLSEEPADKWSPLQMMRETLTHIALETDVEADELRRWAHATLVGLWPNDFTPLAPNMRRGVQSPE